MYIYIYIYIYLLCIKSYMKDKNKEFVYLQDINIEIKSQTYTSKVLGVSTQEEFMIFL